LLDLLQPGDVVVASRLDRVFRDAQDALTVSRELREAGVDLILTDIGTEPANRDGIGRLFLTIMSAVGEFERYRIKERQADGIRSKRGAGGFTGGSRPFGWRVVGEGRGAQLVPVDAEQEAIRLVRSLRASGTSLRKIQAMVDDAGHSMSLMTVKRIVDRQEAA
jgi:DNA invertase Pin-like site-specific DNA recombinase